MSGLKAFERQFLQDGVIDADRLHPVKADGPGHFSGDVLIERLHSGTLQKPDVVVEGMVLRESTFC